MTDTPKLEWPVYAVKTKNGELFYHDLKDGNRHGSGEGWLACLPWGEARECRFMAGDNRICLEHEEVESFTLLTDPLSELKDDVVEAAKLHVDDSPCRLDHHGNCQEHRLGNPCEQDVLKKALAALEAHERGKASDLIEPPIGGTL